jgi:AmmeMemoRadiSam system protein B
MLSFAAITPHPPLLIPAIGGSQLSLVKKTVAAMDELAMELKKIQPHTIAVVSPHGPMRYDKFTINLEDSYRGSFSSYGVYDDAQLDFLGNTPLTKDIMERLRRKYYPVEVIREHTLDYATLVPLYYLIRHLDKRPKIIPLTYTALDWEMHYEFGKILGQAFDEYDQNIVFIASGDLSHRLAEDSPAGYSPYGIKFDHTLLELLKKNEGEKILHLNPEFCSEAGECGLRSIIMGLGTISHFRNSFTQLSYESPFGVGYLVGKWKIG